MIEFEVPGSTGTIKAGNNLPVIFILGPCAIENRDHALRMAASIAEIMQSLGSGWIYKSSFDKANRSSLNSGRGCGMAAGLRILADVRAEFGIPVITDIHQPDQAREVAGVVDMIQIPAFLCRQTDLILAAAATGKPVNIKKGQFLAPGDMQYVAAKAASTGNDKICLCERGTFFGYHNLVVDMRSLVIMRKTGYPVIFDATHSVQLPGEEKSGGEREFVAPLARAAVATGVAGIFMEVHDNPEQAPCDGPNMLRLRDLPQVVSTLIRLDNLIKGNICE